MMPPSDGSMSEGSGSSLTVIGSGAGAGGVFFTSGRSEASQAHCAARFHGPTAAQALPLVKASDAVSTYFGVLAVGAVSESVSEGAEPCRYSGTLASGVIVAPSFELLVAVS